MRCQGDLCAAKIVTSGLKCSAGDNAVLRIRIITLGSGNTKKSKMSQKHMFWTKVSGKLIFIFFIRNKKCNPLADLDPPGSDFLNLLDTDSHYPNGWIRSTGTETPCSGVDERNINDRVWKIWNYTVFLYWNPLNLSDPLGYFRDPLIAKAMSAPDVRFIDSEWLM